MGSSLKSEPLTHMSEGAVRVTSVAGVGDLTNLLPNKYAVPDAALLHPKLESIVAVESRPKSTHR